MKKVALLTHKKDLVNSWEKEGERIDTSLLLRFTVEFVGERGSSTHKKNQCLRLRRRCHAAGLLCL